MRKLTLQLPLLLLIFIGACSDSTVFTNPDGTGADGTGPTNTTGTTEELFGPDDYDLSLYFFHVNTRTAGGEIAFTENYYEKPSGNGPIYSHTKRYLNPGSLSAGISFQSIGSDNAILREYTISENSINEIGVSYNGSQTVRLYTELGEVFLDGIIEDLGLRDTCILQNHFDNFDLGDATGQVTIATGVYEDVLHVFCNRVLDSEDGVARTNYSWNSYFAKGVGLIFADGNWVVLDADNNWVVVGDAYLIPEY